MKSERRGAVTAKDLRHPILRGVVVEHVKALIDAGQTQVYAPGATWSSFARFQRATRAALAGHG